MNVKQTHFEREILNHQSHDVYLHRYLLLNTVVLVDMGLYLLPLRLPSIISKQTIETVSE